MSSTRIVLIYGNKITSSLSLMTVLHQMKRTSLREVNSRL
jgi:hypothetical protein